MLKGSAAGSAPVAGTLLKTPPGNMTQSLAVGFGHFAKSCYLCKRCTYIKLNAYSTYTYICLSRSISIYPDISRSISIYLYLYESLSLSINLYLSLSIYISRFIYLSLVLSWRFLNRCTSMHLVRRLCKVTNCRHGSCHLHECHHIFILYTFTRDIVNHTPVVVKI